ncbi:Gfo/Idh/MocA family oxidoreductase [Pirellulales bacterium]|nr:Gfo/Idh/MocA family oxidoreductase [Pirellulales bacterium]
MRTTQSVEVGGAMINVGIAGIGFMGMVHYLSYQKLPGVRVVAICELNERRLAGDWTDIKGNFGPAGAMMDLSETKTTTDLDEMLALDEVDVVDVTLPPAAHPNATLAALAAGKHVFCEKPLALDVESCREMCAAASAADLRLLVGHVLPYFPEYAWALAANREGRFGNLRGGSFRRVISDPAWLKNYWQADQVGGPLLDLHVHDAHFIRLLFGMPSEVVSRGRQREGLPEYWHSQFSYPDNEFVVTATSGVINQQGRPFNHGFEIHFDKATLLFEFAVIGDEGRYLCPPTILHASGEVEQVSLGDGDPMNAFEAELAEVVACLSENRDSEILNGTLAQDAITLCHRQHESIAAG